MAESSTSYLDALDIDTEAFSIFTNQEEFTLSGRVFTLQRDKTIPFVATINGKTFEATARMTEAALTRVTEQLHVVPSQDNKEIKIISGVLNPVKMDITIDFGSVQKSLQNVLFDLVNAQIKKEKGEPISMELFGRTCYRMGLPIVPNEEAGIDGSMPLLWQHFAADQDQIDAIFDIMEAAGAKSAMPANPGRILRILALPGAGIPVNAVEIGRTDRSMGRHANRVVNLPDGGAETIDGQGFLDFVDAQVTSLQRGVVQRKTRKILAAQLEQLSKDAKPKEDDIAKLKARIEVCTMLSQNWMGQWAGAQRGITVNPDNTANYQDRIFPSNAPSGRMVLQLEDGEKEISFWQNQNGMQAPVSGGVVDTTEGGTMEGEEPF